MQPDFEFPVWGNRSYKGRGWPGVAAFALLIFKRAVYLYIAMRLTMSLPVDFKWIIEILKDQAQ
jgi:hypothetical protein